MHGLRRCLEESCRERVSPAVREVGVVGPVLAAAQRGQQVQLGRGFAQPDGQTAALLLPGSS